MWKCQSLSYSAINFGKTRKRKQRGTRKIKRRLKKRLICVDSPFSLASQNHYFWGWGGGRSAGIPLLHHFKDSNRSKHLKSHFKSLREGILDKYKNNTERINDCHNGWWRGLRSVPDRGVQGRQDSYSTVWNWLMPSGQNQSESEGRIKKKKSKTGIEFLEVTFSGRERIYFSSILLRAGRGLGVINWQEGGTRTVALGTFGWRTLPQTVWRHLRATCARVEGRWPGNQGPRGPRAICPVEGQCSCRRRHVERKQRDGRLGGALVPHDDSED